MTAMFPTECAREIGSPQTLPVRFACEIADIVRAARRACVQLLPWAPEEHQAIIQEAIKRALDSIHAGTLTGAHSDIDLAGHVYGVASRCIRDTRGRRHRADLRAAPVPASGASDANGASARV